MRPTKSRAVRAHDSIGIERWLNEGGHTATEAVIERELADEDQMLGHDEPQELPLDAGAVDDRGTPPGA